MPAEVIVVGGGAAGMLAAIAAARQGASVTLLEKSAELGFKIRLSGGGRCNLTNALEDPRELAAMYPGNGRFLMDALRRFPGQAVRAMLERHGLTTKVEPPEGKVFPSTDRAQDVVSALQSEMEEWGVKLRLQCPVRELVIEEGRVGGVRTDAEILAARAIIVCTGGLSRARAGCTGDGLAMARAVGHRVVEPFPSLVPLRAAVPRDLAGVALRDVLGQVRLAGKPAGRAWRGDLLFTHTGLSGPVVLQLSRHASEGLAQGLPVELILNLVPDRDAGQLDADWISQARGKTLVSALLRAHMPRSVVPCFLEAAGVADGRASELARSDRLRLIGTLQAWRWVVTGWHSMEAAEVTAGGVDVRDVDPRTMASRRIKGLYWAGEVLDVDGYVGGFNFQAAWSTGYVAGDSAAAAIQAAQP